jgi:ABC-type antimicrobial peptide transport system permease subunit
VIGVGVGIVLALGISRILAGAVLIANSFDVVGYAIGIGSVVAACFFAAYMPSRQASAIDPVATLRADS